MEVKIMFLRIHSLGVQFSRENAEILQNDGLLFYKKNTGDGEGDEGVWDVWGLDRLAWQKGEVDL